MEKVLLSKYDSESILRGDTVIHDDFISRRDFINQTGIFVTPSYFDSIYDDFKESGTSVEEFIKNYEEKYSNCIVNAAMNGTFKYEVLDEDLSCLGDYEDTYDPNIWEIIDSLVRTINWEREKKWKQQEEYMNVINQAMDINGKMLKMLKGESLEVTEKESRSLPQ